MCDPFTESTLAVPFHVVCPKNPQKEGTKEATWSDTQNTSACSFLTQDSNISLQMFELPLLVFKAESNFKTEL